MTTPLTKPKSRAAQAFLFALLTAFLLFLPFLIYDRGYFIYYGDFNVQQIPFYRMAHDAVRSGDVFWNWNTDLGANFIGSYSFYLLGSPFFWLTVPFPSEAVPYLMAPLLMLKLSLASLFAYAFLRRFVRPELAVFGGLLYAFSGFSVYNIFFNHFHEAILYFPLMLLGMERYMKDGKRGLFAIAVFLSALSNYYFFIGQAFFLLIYWVIRMRSGDWKCSFGKFFWLFFEAVIGTAMAGIFLLPSYLAVIQNPRTENLIGGWDALIYSRPQRFFDIIHSFFFPQDIPARPNFFPDADNKWASMSAWLPVFGCTGAIAYFQSRRHRDWLHRLLIVCVFCALIPGLNAMFQLFNSMYYARWFYMMVLMLVLATVLSFEQAEETPVNWRRAFGWSFGVTAAFALFIGLMPASWKPDEETEKLSLGLMEYPERFWIFVIIAAVSLALAVLLVLLHRHEPERFAVWTTVTIMVVSLVYGWYLLGLGKANSNYTSDFVIDYAIEQPSFDLPDSGAVCRVDVNNGMDNLGMFWGMPTIQAFHSIVPGSVTEFYESIGVDRGVASRPSNSHYAIRSLLSVRWLFEFANEDGKEYWDDSKTFEKDTVTVMPDWEYTGIQNGFRMYENENYIPLGFTYDAYITRSAYNELSDLQRELVMLKALVVEDADEMAAAALLPPLSPDQQYTRIDFAADCQSRRASSASRFTRDNGGFEAAISLDTSNLVFFSVPYEAGWTATVNGIQSEILKTNVGFMAVVCPAGEVTIRFDYQTPGLWLGSIISLTAAGLFLLYWLLFFLRRHRRKATDDTVQPLAERTGGMEGSTYLDLLEEPGEAFPLSLDDMADTEETPKNTPVPPPNPPPAQPSPSQNPEDPDDRPFDPYKPYSDQ